MALRPRWYRWLIVLATLLSLSACSASPGTNTIKGAKASSGPVTVTTDLSAYATGQAIGASVVNTGTTVFYARDGKSGCSVLQLERYDSGKSEWTPVDACVDSPGIQTYTITATSSIPYTLAPNSPSDPNAWQTGMYRIAIAYTTNGDGTTNLQEAHSAAFTVHG